jgi:HAE1 family hydrophobic/amphiphilic exporter-1
VTKPIERAISGIPRLEGLQSTSANSLSLVIAQFSFGSDVKEIRATIEQNLQNAGLPQTVSPQVSALNINSSPVIIASIAATSEDGLNKAAAITKAEIEPALLGIEGVGSVDVTGGEEQQVLITLDPDKLTANGISVGQVTGVLAANNLTFPSGQITGDRQDPGLHDRRIGGVEEIESLVVGVANASPIPAVLRRAWARRRARPARSAGLQPAASSLPPLPPRHLGCAGRFSRSRHLGGPQMVTIGTSAPVELAGVATTGYARTNGKPSLSLSAPKTSNANTVAVADEVTAIPQ